MQHIPICTGTQGSSLEGKYPALNAQRWAALDSRWWRWRDAKAVDGEGTEGAAVRHRAPYCFMTTQPPVHSSLKPRPRQAVRVPLLCVMAAPVNDPLESSHNWPKLTCPQAHASAGMAHSHTAGHSGLSDNVHRGWPQADSWKECTRWQEAREAPRVAAGP